MSWRWTVERDDAGGSYTYEVENDRPMEAGLTAFANEREATAYALKCDLLSRDAINGAIARHRAALRRLSRSPTEPEDR